MGLGTNACADPCNDDGLAQGGCPSQSTDSTETDDGQDTDDTSSSTGGDTTGSDGETAGNETQSSQGGGGDTSVDESGETGGGGFACPSFDETLLPTTPTLQLVIDRSGTMNDPFGDGEQTRWESLRETLLAPKTGVVVNLQSQVRFGASLYTGTGGQCPSVDTFEPQLDALDELSDLLSAEPGGQTPTGESVLVALDTLRADPWKGEKFLVLATDGEPDTCAVPNPGTDDEVEEARAAARRAVEEAFAAGFPTFIISVGAEINEGHLQDLANAGVGNQPGDPDAPFSVALDQQELIDAFDRIVDGFRQCEFDLETPLVDSAIPLCEVLVNDAVIPFDSTDGWQRVDENSLELVGTACESIQKGVVNVELTCSCE